MTSAIERLRELLDERGVEYEGGERSLRWRDRYGIMMQAFPLANGELGMGVWSCTPEQAVAATLGWCNCSNSERTSERTETCRRVRGRKSYRAYGGYRIECSACGYGLADKRYRFCPNCGRKVVDE